VPRKNVERLPIAIQTLYADLVERAWSGDLAELAAGGGSAYTREASERKYWYWQPSTRGGVRPSARYIGPDTQQVRSRIERLSDTADNLKERRDMVRSLRAARLPVPDSLTGDVVEAFAKAGVFRLRAVLVGSVAFQSYAGLLGVRVPSTLSRTDDIDIAQFHAIALLVEDRIDRDLEKILKDVDPRFEGIPDPMDTRRTMRYALRIGSEERFSVDVLSPLRGPERGRLTELRALRSNAQLLRFLDYLLYQEVNAVCLHGAGVPINVPAPERYALHKLLVAQMRHAIPKSQAKARKDLEQAAALINVLNEVRKGDLNDAWEELRNNGPSWQHKADRSLLQLSTETREILAPEMHPR